MEFPAYVSLFLGIIGLVGAVFGVGFYIRSTSTKANFEGLKETVATLKANRDEWKNQAQELERENKQLRDEKAGLIGENKTLREIATQTPEILQLTKAVTALTKTVERGQKQIVRYFSKNAKAKDLADGDS